MPSSDPLLSFPARPPHPAATDRETGKARGFGHVDFETPAQAIKATELHESELDGRTIKVSPWVTGARLYIATHVACRPGCLLTRKLTGNADFLGGKHGK